jgi:hypothetical protein
MNPFDDIQQLANLAARLHEHVTLLADWYSLPPTEVQERLTHFVVNSPYSLDTLFRWLAELRRMGYRGEFPPSVEEVTTLYIAHWYMTQLGGTP